MLVGYARTSDIKQHLDRQLETFKQLGIEKIYQEKVSGKNADRKELKEMLSFVRTGDVVYCDSISRISRNTRDLLNIIDTLNAKGVEFVSIKEAIDTRSPQGQFMLTVFGALAELERESMLERQREGIRAAQVRGAYQGKPKLSIDEDRFVAECKKWRAGEQTAVATYTKLGLKNNTFYRRVKELGL